MNSNSRGRGRRSRQRRTATTPFASNPYFFDSHAGSPLTSSRNETKARQLCRQVQRRLELALGELDDPLLQGLWIHAVVPEPGGRALLVQLVDTEAHPIHELLARLDVVRGRLRADVAAAIHRKRTPQLHFMIVPEAPSEEVDP